MNIKLKPTSTVNGVTVEGEDLTIVTKSGHEISFPDPDEDSVIALEGGSAPTDYATYSQATAIISDLENSNYGLSAIDANIDNFKSDIINNQSYGLIGVHDFVSDNHMMLANGTYGLSRINTRVEDALSVVNSNTYGLSAIKNAVNSASSYSRDARDNAYDVYNIVHDGTYGNSAIYNAVTGVSATLNDGAYGNSAIKDQVDDVYDIVNDPTYGNNTLNQKLDDVLYTLGDVASVLDAINGETI